ncbi:MAG: FAD-binding oxidoreductase [Gammaproteobacteria bacterium]|jgi:FAD/FMN-containing dehydrogenase|nr:FAD-binding oxidoreductase [Gammaproteobacteria bacterium]MBT5202992.1 FAD-binding oxidoreductase [Gammaproteobacteria bacterium]MBT6244407.1 FAD-binding oxidoreductase [Gammaproteobacteria bacterium]
MSQLIESLQSQLGEKGVLTGDLLAEKFIPHGCPAALLRPQTTEEVSQALKLCHEASQSVIPYGGLTGLVEATASDQSEIAISLERMNQIEEIDIESRTMTVQAGVPLQVVQEAADKADMLFPLDIGARGSATIGGNVSTNAGGNRVIRYGMMRDQILGMEVVLADGRVITSMNKIIKNNTGYDLKQLFVGAEGTLGIVTRIVLRLRPKPKSQQMAFVGVNTFSEVTRVLNLLDGALGGSLSAFEVLWKDYYQLVTTAPAEGKPPLAHDYGYYILVEALGGDEQSDEERFLNVLAEAMEEGTIADAVVAQSQGERNAMWAIRDDVGQVAQNWPIFAFDISVPLNQMESYVAELTAELDERWQDNTCMVFGHLGDGNLHIIVGMGEKSAAAKKAVEQVVYSGLPERGGSVSAEHGIGVQKKAYLSWSRSTDEIALMQMMKTALDPKGILNPGKIFSS